MGRGWRGGYLALTADRLLQHGDLGENKFLNNINEFLTFTQFMQIYSLTADRLLRHGDLGGREGGARGG